MSGQSTVEKFWYSRNYWRWLFYPLSLMVQSIAVTKRFLYRLKIFKSHSFDLPIIVVGNINVGGTGKTPFISYLVKALQSKKLRVAIVSRGYQSNAERYPHLVLAKDNVETVGDEAFMQFRQTGVPMAIGADRSAAINLLKQKYKLDVIISDDGLQHYAMSRDIEILMVDAERLFGNELMLPFGPLREPVSRIKSSDLIVVNGGPINYSRLKCLTVPVVNMSLITNQLFEIKSGDLISLDKLKDNNFTAVAGIGNPQRFFTSLSQYNTNFKTQVFSDHHQFKLDDLIAISTDMIVMTEKDAVKCQQFVKNNWYYLKAEAKLTDSDFEKIYQLLQNKLN